MRLKADRAQLEAVRGVGRRAHTLALTLRLTVRPAFVVDGSYPRQRATTNESTLASAQAALAETKGKLETSELAGIVEGWIERASAAEAKLKTAIVALEDIAQRGGALRAREALRSIREGGDLPPPPEPAT